MSPGHAPAPMLEGFVLQRPLGSGGFAEVYLYRQQLPSREVAIKVLHEGVTARTAANFTAEANVMAQLSTHPSIVTIFQAAIAPDGRPYLVMEYYPRPNLYVRSRSRPLPVPDALDIMIRIAGAVETAHRAGIIHRDIKPANILTSAYGRPGLTDFGISAAKSEIADREAGLSIPWCAREVVAGENNGDERSDVFSLTATLYSLLSGRSPFEVPGQRNSPVDLLARISSGTPAELARTDVPIGLGRVISMGLDPDPENRPQSAAAFARLLQEVEMQLHLSVTPLDVLSDGIEHAPDRDDDEAATRVRSATVVRPSAGEKSLIHAVPEPASAVSDTPDVPPPEAISEDPTGKPGRKPIVPIVATVGLIAIVVVVGLAASTLGRDGTNTPSATPTLDQDAVPEVVPPPTDLAITRVNATTASATWAIADPREGDRYGWQRADPAGAGEMGTSETTSLTLDGLAADDQPCLTVWLIRSTGERSESSPTVCATN